MGRFCDIKDDEDSKSDEANCMRQSPIRENNSRETGTMKHVSARASSRWFFYNKDDYAIKAEQQRDESRVVFWNERQL